MLDLDHWRKERLKKMSRYSSDPAGSLLVKGIDIAGKSVMEAYRMYLMERQTEDIRQRQLAELEGRLFDKLYAKLFADLTKAISIEVVNEAGPVVKELNGMLKNLGN